MSGCKQATALKTITVVVQPTLSVWLKNQLQPFAKSIDIAMREPDGNCATLSVRDVAKEDMKQVEEVISKIKSGQTIDYEHCDHM